MRRTYDLPDNVLSQLDDLAAAYAKDKMVAAGIRLFAAAPADLREAAIRANDAEVKEFFRDAVSMKTVELYERMKREAEEAAKGKSSRKRRDDDKG